jgi:hypothetical protein
MKRRNGGPGRLNNRQRIYFVIFGITMLLPGLMALLRGGNGYLDERGLVVFAPAMILAGALMILIGIAKGRPARGK